MPGPAAPILSLTPRQREVLEKLSRRAKLDHQAVTRARLLLLAADGLANARIARELSIHRESVRNWRKRWSSSSERLQTIESTGDEKQLTSAIVELLSDQQRSGRPLVYSAEIVCQILAISCEKPEECGHPISHWTPKALRQEVLKRGIVDDISVRQIGRFLKRGGSEASPGALLGKSAG